MLFCCLLGLLQVVLSHGQGLETIRVLYINEDTNLIAEEAVNVAVDYADKENLVLVKLTKLAGNRTDAEGILTAMCKEYDAMLEAKEPPHIILDTTMTGMVSETVKSFSKALGLPTISASFGQTGDLRQWRDLSPTEQKYLIQIMPPADSIPQIVRSIVENQNITNAAIMFDENYVMDHKYKSLLQNVPTRHIISPVEKNIVDQLKRFRNLDLMNYFILGSLEKIKSVFEAAETLGYYGRKFAWHAITMDPEDPKVICERCLVIFARPVLNRAYKTRNEDITELYKLKAKPAITADFYFDLALKAFLAAKDLASSWPGDNEFLTCAEYENNTPRRQIDLTTIFQKEVPSQTPMYGPISLDRNGKSHMIFDMEILGVNILGTEIATPMANLGTWNSHEETGVFSDNSEMKKYLADVVYVVATVIQEPFIFVNESAPKGFDGYCIDLINEIADILHFDYEIYAVKDGKFGNMDAEGKWNGVVKDLMIKKADIGLGSMSVMAERENVIDFTVPYYDLVGITILMKLPETPTSLFKFLTVLEHDVWLCILAAYFFTSFLMWVFDRWSPYSYQNNREKYKDDDEKREFSLKECLWFCMTSLTPQGGGEAPKNLSGRLVAATWWLFGFIIIASYTANLAAFLTVSRLESPVESLDGLSKQYKITYAPLNGSDAMVYFERMANIELKFYEIWKDMSLNDSLSDLERSKLAVWDYPVSDRYTKMWQAMKEATLPRTMEEAVARVRKSRSSSEGFAFLGDATDIKFLTYTTCDLQSIGEEFSRKPYAIAVQQGSPLRDQFNTAILALLNKRQLERFKEKWWTNNPKRKECEKADDQSDGISIQNIGGVFIVIFVGIGLACVTLAFEYWWYKYRKNPQVISVHEVTDPPEISLPDKPKGKSLFSRNKF